MEEFYAENDAQEQTVKQVDYHLTEHSKAIPGVSEMCWITQVVDSSEINASVMPVLGSVLPK